jgi:methylase of polypeptide subunit release factors
VAQVEIDLMALEITNLRVLSAEASQRAPGPEGIDTENQRHGNSASHQRIIDAGTGTGCSIPAGNCDVRL